MLRQNTNVLKEMNQLCTPHHELFQKKSATGEGVGREGVEENPGLNYQYIYIYIYIYIYDMMHAT